MGGFIYEYRGFGIQTIFAPGLDRPRGVAFDNAGNLFFADTAFNHIKITPGGVPSTFASPPSIQSFGLAFDSAGNLYTGVNFPQPSPSSTQVQPQIWKYAPDGTSSVFATASPQNDGNFIDLAFDRFGNLFVSIEAGGDDTILRYTPDGSESTFATGLSWPRGLAFDSAGNLFVAEEIPGADDILKFTPAGIRSVFAPPPPCLGNC